MCSACIVVVGLIRTAHNRCATLMATLLRRTDHADDDSAPVSPRFWGLAKQARAHFSKSAAVSPKKCRRSHAYALAACAVRYGATPRSLTFIEQRTRILLQAEQDATSLPADWSPADTVPADVLAQPSRPRYVPVINRERLVMAGVVGTGSRPGKVNQPVETSALDFTLRRLVAKIAKMSR